MTLVVEDGTGLSNADSYISVTDAGLYFTAYGNSDTWTAYDADSQEVALRAATRAIDSLYGASFMSKPLTTTQALKQPRQLWYNEFSNAMTGIAPCLGQATAEMALMILGGFDPISSADNAGAIKETQVKVGDVEQKKVYFYPQNAKSNLLAKISTILSPLLSPASSGNSGFYSVVRG